MVRDIRKDNLFIDLPMKVKIFLNCIVGYGKLPEDDRVVRIHHDKPVTKNILFYV